MSNPESEQSFLSVLARQQCTESIFLQPRIFFLFPNFHGGKEEEKKNSLRVSGFSEFLNLPLSAAAVTAAAAVTTGAAAVTAAAVTAAAAAMRVCTSAKKIEERN